MSESKYSFEIVPPRSLSQIDDLMKLLARLEPCWVNVTNHRDFNGAMRTSIYVKENFAMKPAMHLRVGDPISGLLDRLSEHGIEDLFLVRGEDDGRPFASELVRKVRAIDLGRRFRVGVAGYPQKHRDAPDLESDIRNLKAKVDQGADYILSQMFFDNRAFYQWVDRCRAAGIEVPIIPGLIPLTEPLIGLIGGLFSVPILQLLRRGVTRSKAFGLEWMLEQIKDLRDNGYAHVHIFVMNDMPMVERIVGRLMPQEVTLDAY
ncbi:MAG: methylenetetrahydrofolate reductase [Pseudobdellovibrionaceae bacterium]